jgi:hypothetical protein
MVHLTFAVGEEEKLRQARISFGFRQPTECSLGDYAKEKTLDPSK